jgi:hypothetical protein
MPEADGLEAIEVNYPRQSPGLEIVSPSKEACSGTALFGAVGVHQLIHKSE